MLCSVESSAETCTGRNGSKGGSRLKKREWSFFGRFPKHKQDLNWPWRMSVWPLKDLASVSALLLGSLTIPVLWVLIYSFQNKHIGLELFFHSFTIQEPTTHIRWSWCFMMKSMELALTQGMKEGLCSPARAQTYMALWQVKRTAGEMS